MADLRPGVLFDVDGTLLDTNYLHTLAWWRALRATGHDEITMQQCHSAIGIASAAGYALHAPAGALPAHAVGYIYLPAAIGVAIASVLAAPYGTRLAHRIGGKALKQVFAAFMVMMGIAILASG